MHRPYKGLGTTRRRLTDWEIHSVLSGCLAVYQLLAAGQPVDWRHARLALPAIRKLVRDTWRDVINTCRSCSKKIRAGAGTRTKKGWRVHKRCARKKGALS